MKREDVEYITKGNPLAADFLEAMGKFCHLVDDVIDEPKTITDRRLVEELLEFIRQFALNPWVREHSVTLWPLIVAGANSWLDSNRWQEYDHVKYRLAADVLKGQYHEIAWYTAYLCGGLEHMQNVTLQYRKYDFQQQLTTEGKPI